MGKTINALLPYFGAKRQEARVIVEALGDHQAYWEPFCGSMAVLLAKPKCRTEVVNDLNGGLVNLATVVQDDELSVKLFDRLNRTMFCEAVYEESRHAHSGFCVDPWPRRRNLDWAYHYLVVGWMGRNGLVGTDREFNSGFCKRFTSNGGDPAVRWKSVVASLPSWWERLQGVTVLSEDGIGLLGRIEDKQGTAIYLDPPYFEKGGDYLHDFNPEKHVELAEACRRFKRTRVVVSYYSHPMVDELYVRHGFEKRPVDIRKNMTVAAVGGEERAPEVLLVNN